MSRVVCLGIESTAHTFGVGVVDSEGRVLANVNRTYKPASGGIHPREASQHHAAVAAEVIREAFREAGVEPGDVDAVAFSIGPGMGPCLRTGATAARALSLRLGKPLVAVNHAVAHVEIGKLTTGCRSPVVLYVAGGNTLVTSLVEGRYRVLGETLDIAAGNCLDSFGITAGVGPMPAAEKLAEKGERIYELPYRVKGMDVSFSGLLTAAEKLLSEGAKPEDVALSLTETVYSMLTEVSERALAYLSREELLLVGGLARSKRLMQMLEIMCSDRGARLFRVPDEYAGDNGAMIAWTGLLHYLAGDVIKPEESRVRPRQRIDEVLIKWDNRG
ncbi:MAG TPA: N(6)-L-threonylcarbamoyladenine synthase Kae1 [Candidatus Caldiarchaeum subterraneum]|uniref:tRNA N6-adenosine threonylcarbamoyltransferase n=1 Tax=Caldiarchaeum subterraneum TaxID=311458 RepID=A0A833E909_CALS0|nr:N(6)-L-threonylcarbamoyladenine synthase Kae1 [Candidatus Caldarchaeum subterraneum]